ncbi:MAG: hypothetical protein U0271_12505 [Polyangiaceae bacterium]
MKNAIPCLAILTALTACTEVRIIPHDHESDVGGAGGEASNATGGGATGGGGADSCAPSWTRILGGTGANWLRSQAVGSDGSVAVTIDSTSDLSLDGESLGFDDGGLVVVKLDKDGALAWARHFGRTSQQPLMPVGIGPTGNVVVGGIGYQTVTIGDLTAEHEGAFGYVVSFSPEGTPQWIQSWGVPTESGGLVNLALDPAGNVYFQGSLGYDQDVLEWDGLSTTGETFVGKILASGEAAWVRGYRGFASERRGLATTPTGHLVIGQTLQLTADFGDPPLSTNGDYDSLVMDLDPDGVLVDAKQFGDDGLQRSVGFSIGKDGSRALMGITWGAIDFGNGPVAGQGADDLFLASFDASGASRWTKVAPNKYASVVFSSTDSGGLTLVVSSAVAASFGCPAEADSTFMRVELDATGTCTRSEVIAFAGEAPYSEMDFAGVEGNPERTVVSGYFAGDYNLYGELYTADIWDSFVAVRNQCETN